MAGDSPKTISVNNDLYLKAEKAENDYPLLIVGGSSVSTRISLQWAKTQVLGVLTGDSVSDIIYRVIQCESGWNQGARGAAGEIGIAQYMPATWKHFNKLRGTNLNIYSSDDQIDMTIWAFNNGYANHWTCYRKLCQKDSAIPATKF